MWPGKIFLLTFALWLLSSITGVTHAAVSAQLSAQDIDELETVRLTIRASETRTTETLDLQALERDFHVMGTNTSSQYRFINGREQSWIDYQITLQPKTTGRLTIPSITVGDQQTPTLSLRVRALSQATREAIDKLVFFENELSRERVYVQAELILTRRLLYSDGAQLYSDLPGAPEVENAVVLELGETVSRTAQRFGRTYGLLEQRYAIFPESSGTLTIPGISVTASVRLRENGRVSRKGVRVGTPVTTVQVDPVPDEFPADHPWLPAEAVTLHQVLTPPRNHNVGDTLTHELLIHIQGNMGSAAPPRELAVDTTQLRIYPQAPVINDDTQNTQVFGSRLQTASVVPLQPGRPELPEQSVFWWDTASDRLRISTTPPIPLNIGGTAVQAPTPPANAGAGQTADENQTGQTEAAEPTPWLTSRDGWRLAMIAAGVVVGALAWWAFLKASWLQRGIGRAAQAMGRLVPRRRRLPRDLLNETDPAALLKRMADFLATEYGWSRATALQRLATNSPEAAALLHELRATAWSAAADSAAVSDAQRQQLRDILLAPTRRRQRTSQDDLPPLYAHEHQPPSDFVTTS